MRPVILLSCTRPAKKGRGDGDCGYEADDSLGRRDGLLMSYCRGVVLAGGAPRLLPNTADTDDSHLGVFRWVVQRARSR